MQEAAASCISKDSEGNSTDPPPPNTILSAWDANPKSSTLPLVTPCDAGSSGDLEDITLQGTINRLSASLGKKAKGSGISSGIARAKIARKLSLAGLALSHAGDGNTILPTEGNLDAIFKDFRKLKESNQRSEANLMQKSPNITPFLDLNSRGNMVNEKNVEHAKHTDAVPPRVGDLPEGVANQTTFNQKDESKSDRITANKENSTDADLAMEYTMDSDPKVNKPTNNIVNVAKHPKAAQGKTLETITPANAASDKYTSLDCPPYVVHIKDTNPVPLHPIHISKIVSAIFPKGMGEVTKIAKGQVAIVMNSTLDANKLVGNAILTNKGLHAFVPKYKLMRIGTVRGIPQDLDTQTISQNIKSSSRIRDINRLNRRVKTDQGYTYEPSRSLSIQFAGQALPNHVVGHISNSCKSKARCIYCGEDKHEDKDYVCALSTGDHTCLNCKGNHLPTSHECPTVISFKKAQALAATENISMQEARRRIISMDNTQHSNTDTPRDFLRKFFDTLAPLGNILLVGDFNAHHPAWGGMGVRIDCMGTRLLDSFEEAGLTVLNTSGDTFMSLSHGTFSGIDIALASAALAPLCSVRIDSDLRGSDHFPLFTSIGQLEPSRNCFKYKIKLSAAESRELRHMLEREQSVFSEALPADPIEAYNYMVSFVLERIRSIVGDKRSSKGSSTRTNRPEHVPALWWSEECDEKCRDRKAALLHFRKSPSASSLNDYRKTAEECAKTLRRYKSKGWKELCTSFTGKTPSAEVWKLVKAYKKRRLLLTNGTEEQTVPFEDQVNLAQDKLCPPSCEFQINMDSYLRECKLRSGGITREELGSPLTIEELNGAMSHFKGRKSAPGEDQLDFRILSTFPPLMIKHMLGIFNTFLKTGITPPAWRRSLVILIPKPNGTGLRPIALLPCLLK
ncbi:PREDICTED: uncharacterized protein LOC105570780, partial [Vollenhovia emeryi]|uniref:uncharacterized protein LOC105570780 n=1 Tax=Vollenhovia emeryi TaxID=411798 RepID=UPI0005F585C4